MTFTDDNLKRLKEVVNTKRTFPHVAHSEVVTDEAIEALCARLEAAEECTQALIELNGFLIGTSYEGKVPILDRVIRKWCKTAGK